MIQISFISICTIYEALSFVHNFGSCILYGKYLVKLKVLRNNIALCLYFNLSSNFLRMCILRVTQQSNKHLDKILNIDEFVRRIFFVIHSNDPVARALTLRYSLTLIYWKFCVSYFVKVDSKGNPIEHFSQNLHFDPKMFTLW